MKKKILEYSISTAVCSILTFVLIWTKGTFTCESPKLMYKYLVDSFFTVGVVAIGFGLLVVVSNWGAFDFIIYGVYRFVTLFKKNHKDVKYQTYYDYHIARAEKEKAEFVYLVIVGAVFIAASLILLYFWYQY